VYTGFIGEIGIVLAVGPGQLEVAAPKAASSLRVGGSFNVAGVCVSAEEIDGGTIRCSLSDETRRRSTLGDLPAGAPVNVEVPLAAGDALEGHLVQGHVDAVGKVTRIDGEGAGRRVWIRPPERVLKEVVAKGSIAVDGVSLTIAEIVRDRFSVALIPSTLAGTTLVHLEAGDRVNLETDLVGKLAAKHGAASHDALARTVAQVPWAGVVHGALGVEKVVAQIAAGGAALVWDEEREGEGDVIVAAAALRPQMVTFILTQACSHLTVPCDRNRLDRLGIVPMPGPGDHQGTAMHVSVDLAATSGTGVSAVERAATIRQLADPDARPEDFVAPGHVFPLSARPGLLRERAGHTEATVALCVAAGLPSVGVCCEVMNRDGTMAGPAELERFALEWGLPLIGIDELTARL
jgi:3,4-dihydroxy 2-butanone 4-phosphate synthase/3,4-dihydroxy 2-butanone 4-phosphate synthase/GTP cyclohydrolase II